MFVKLQSINLRVLLAGVPRKLDKLIKYNELLRHKYLRFGRFETAAGISVAVPTLKRMNLSSVRRLKKSKLVGSNIMKVRERSLCKSFTG